MRRRAFILTEILTGLMLQSMFVITLFGAFYMVLTFGTSTQQTLAAGDQGQLVISYIDNRIRNAGIGLWKCEKPLGVAEAFGLTQAASSRPMPALMAKNAKGTHTDMPMPIPVAVLSADASNKMFVSSDDRVYEGNVLVLLYAHKDNNNNKLVVLKRGAKNSDAQIPAGSSDEFKFINNFNENKPQTNFDFTGLGAFQIKDRYKNIKYWAAAEASGVPFRVADYKSNESTKKAGETTSYSFTIHAPFQKVTIHPMSELLNLECQKMYVQNNSFYFANIDNNGSVWNPHPHTSSILELHMTLDTNPPVPANAILNQPIPILDLQVLVSEGLRDDGQTTKCPPNWPESYWRKEFETHKVHVSQATWKLYNLAPIFHP